MALIWTERLALNTLRNTSAWCLEFCLANTQCTTTRKKEESIFKDEMN